ncbi:hypothetical protein PPTG_22812 [Phytophthora nicotianae INRA-310]|uniref:Uncharacterized protein n=1 Tax=Phytophthora nicotianae (strain INRA-310) TaxID=761204 RepID=W2Q8W9_PHYN3|nr:hypothetical protein PPTG_22812 [Phytophthora nicotianae INRA-310]ETN09623.1 hypothetical protein PPTG_22812 [Phytophthora nicotianae INRA-310]
MADENLITECSGESTSNSAITSRTTSLTDAEDVDENGIPVSVKHSTQNFFATVWAYIHLLAVPIPDSTSPGRPYTHICIVCANERKSADPTSTAWKSCLMRQKTSSNARKHMLKMHKSHAYSKETKQAGQDDKTCRIKAFDASDKPNTKKQRTIQETFVINRDEIRILATRWLLSSGLPFTTLENEELQNFLRRLSNNPSLVIPARDTFYAFADGEYQNFFQLVSLSLRKDFDAVLQQPFLSVLHDLATNAAIVNIIGTTVVYIDSEWRLRTVSLLALANSSGHAAHHDSIPI